MLFIHLCVKNTGNRIPKNGGSFNRRGRGRYKSKFLRGGSSAAGSSGVLTGFPAVDFYGNARKTTSGKATGAVEHGY
jgi:hypothetical protein